ncbi:uncharacterized protein BJ212DRAFT_1358740 [Suillus subaureus]|uniref:Uncharacterized protein n=1 Tax=Suillus subaureus TaxID=48587 RepID=A0A9P7E9Q0_9AGAM|nr:uncharacterized protein BJ212DRAFT_1358740 [Suillus subaureus]KAG1815000.1 hypothetical protein BJ212DRAFT_1358740 [Suillus subaureus]
MPTPSLSQATPYIPNSTSAHPPEAPTEGHALPLLPSATKPLQIRSQVLAMLIDKFFFLSAHAFEDLLMDGFLGR